VVDFACGSGLNMRLIQKQIGPTGTLIGADLTTGMLRRAQARARRAGWSNVNVVQLDVTYLTRERLEQAGAVPNGMQVDAVLCTLGTSVIPEWETAWEAMLALVRPGGTAAVMDGSPPPQPTVATRLVRPLVRLGCCGFAPAGHESRGTSPGATSRTSRSRGPSGVTCTPQPAPNEAVPRRATTPTSG
jgi:ubiquinone/menaquinone biosynthesis C-methylase UbiE